jgi:MFS family permease
MTRRIAFALLAMGTAQAAVYLVRPTTSYRLLGLGHGATAVGLVTAAFALVPLFLAIPLGRRADRRHGGRLLLAGCAVQVLGCLLLAGARSPFALAAASAVVGVGHLALALGSQAVVARESHDERHDQHFALLTAGVSMGQLVGPLLGGLLLGGRSGTALISATSRAMLVAAGIAGLATLFAVVAERDRVEGGLEVPKTGSSVAAIIGTRGVPAGIFASIAVLSAADVFTAYMPVLGEQRSIGPAVIGAMLAIRAGASLASRTGIGALVRRFGRLRLIAVSAGAAAAAMVGLTFTDDVWLLAALSAVVGAGLGFGQPLSMTIVVQLVPEYARATALAVRLTGNRIGQVAAPAAAGLVAGSAGARSVFWLMSGVLVASSVAVRRPPAEGEVTPPPEAIADAGTTRAGCRRS